MSLTCGPDRRSYPLILPDVPFFGAFGSTSRLAGFGVPSAIRRLCQVLPFAFGSVDPFPVFGTGDFDRGHRLRRPSRSPLKCGKYCKKSGKISNRNQPAPKRWPTCPHIWQLLEWCVSWDFVVKIFRILNSVRAGLTGPWLVVNVPSPCSNCEKESNQHYGCRQEVTVESFPTFSCTLQRSL